MDNVKLGRVPSIEKVQLLAQYLGVTVSELLGETASGQVPPLELTSEELRAVQAYRQAAPALQAAVRRVLGID